MNKELKAFLHGMTAGVCFGLSIAGLIVAFLILVRIITINL